MHYSVISGDIVSSSSLLPSEREALSLALHKLIALLEDQYGVYGRVVKGDYLECVVPTPGNGLRIALIIKSFVKSIAASVDVSGKDANRIKQHKTHGIRLAIGYGSLTQFDTQKDIIDGDAIYLSGREISGETSYNKSRVVIKNTLFFASKNEDLNESLYPLFALLDVILTKATARQCEVLYLKLMNKTEEEIAEKLAIGQSAVNQHSTSVGWNAIESAVNYFDNRISKL